MKTLSRRCRKVAPLILLGLLIDQTPVNQSAQALVGGPFDDNNFPGVTADGTYSGTVTGQNLIGIVSFGISSSSEGNGRFAIFHEGLVNYGAASGIADLASRRIAGSFLGVAGIVDVGGNNAGGAGGSGTSTGAPGTLSVRSGIEGSFIAKMNGYPQQITFEGEGELSSTANTIILTGSTTGLSDFSVSFDAPGSPGSDTEAGTSGNVTVEAFTNPAVFRTSTPFKIRGSRTSRLGYTVINNYTGVLPFSVSTPPPATPTAPPTAVPVIAP